MKLFIMQYIIIVNTVILDHANRPSLLKPIRFVNWFYFDLQVKMIRKSNDGTYGSTKESNRISCLPEDRKRTNLLYVLLSCNLDDRKSPKQCL
jgi:hypothetical protein